MTFHDALQWFNANVTPVLWGSSLCLIAVCVAMAFDTQRRRKQGGHLCDACKARAAKGKWIKNGCAECNKAFAAHLRVQYAEIAALIRQNIIYGRLYNVNPPGSLDEAKWYDAVAAHGRTYEVGAGGKTIKCLACGMTSFSPEDVTNKYCGKCHKFHQDLVSGKFP